MICSLSASASNAVATVSSLCALKRLAAIGSLQSGGTYFIPQALVRYQYRVKQRYTKCHRVMIDVLVAAREEAELSKRELSTMLKRPPNFVYYVESGERTLSVCEFIEYARAVGADPVKLLALITDRS